jgi:lipopolysaccharide transport system permease protein
MSVVSEQAGELAANRTKYHRTIRPATRWISLNLPEVWHYRDLLLTLAQRDVRLRYRQTALGALWVVLQPLIAAGIFTFVFQKVAGLSGNGIPYFALAFTGQVAWMAFSSTLSKSASSLVGNASLVSKVFFPRLVLPLSTVPSTALDFTVGFVVITVLMMVYGIVPFWGILTLPVWFLLIVMLSLGIGLICASAMVRYRDVGYIVPVALQMLLYASPIGYSLQQMESRLGETFIPVYLLLNPLAALVEAFRWSLFHTENVPWFYVGYAAIVSVVVLTVGAMAFRQQERKFADVI